MTSIGAPIPGLDTLGPPDVVLDRIDTLLRYYASLGVRITNAFLSESIDDQGGRNFESLWLFNESETFEATLSASDDDQFDGARIRSNLVRWEVRSRNYDFDKATADSRFAVTVWFTNDLWGELKATGSNCDALRDVVRRHIVPEIGAAGGATSPS